MWATAWKSQIHYLNSLDQVASSIYDKWNLIFTLTRICPICLKYESGLFPEETELPLCFRHFKLGLKANTRRWKVLKTWVWIILIKERPGKSHYQVRRWHHHKGPSDHLHSKHTFYCLPLCLCARAPRPALRLSSPHNAKHPETCLLVLDSSISIS